MMLQYIRTHFTLAMTTGGGGGRMGGGGGGGVDVVEDGNDKKWDQCCVLFDNLYNIHMK